MRLPVSMSLSTASRGVRAMSCIPGRGLVERLSRTLKPSTLRYFRLSPASTEARPSALSLQIAPKNAGLCVPTMARVPWLRQPEAAGMLPELRYQSDKRSGYSNMRYRRRKYTVM